LGHATRPRIKYAEGKRKKRELNMGKVNYFDDRKANKYLKNFNRNMRGEGMRYKEEEGPRKTST